VDVVRLLPSDVVAPVLGDWDDLSPEVRTTSPSANVGTPFSDRLRLERFPQELAARIPSLGAVLKSSYLIIRSFQWSCVHPRIRSIEVSGF
jgi:hypothetical protein